MSNSVSQFLAAAANWAKNQADISELLLVGSHAAEKATPDSDIDLVLLCKYPVKYLKHTKWIEQFGLVKDQKIEDWGKLSSLRVNYQNGLEVEYGFTSLEWIDLPLDAGTLNVLNDGYKVLVDKQGRFAKLKRATSAPFTTAG